MEPNRFIRRFMRIKEKSRTSSASSVLSVLRFHPTELSTSGAFIGDLMELDEFVKLHKPASTSRSRLAPYLADIYRLRRLGYSWVQVQEYLATKGVTVAFQTVAAYVKRHPEQPGESSKLSKPRQTMTTPAPTPVQPEKDRTEANPSVNEEQHEDDQTSDSSFFKPSDLRDIMQSSVDLKTLAKIGKSQKPKRKKPHETGSD